MALAAPLDCKATDYHQQRYKSYLLDSQPSDSSYAAYVRKQIDDYPTVPKALGPARQLNYLLALNLIECEDVLPSLIRAIVNMIRLVQGDADRSGRFHVSIIENGSTDRSPALLWLFSRMLIELHVGFTIKVDSRTRTTSVGHRVEELARLRNEVLKPLFYGPAGTFDRVIFFNDVHLCEMDILELMYSHEMQEADMSCGMDWLEDHVEKNGEKITVGWIGRFKGSSSNRRTHYCYSLVQQSVFYDTWVARDMDGG